MTEPSPTESLQLVADRIRSSRKGRKKDQQFSALGACIFGGGFSHGVEEAGFRVAGHLELPDCDIGSQVSRQRWPVVMAPLNKGYPHHNRVYPRDPTTWFNAVGDLRDNAAIPDFLYMNPPCNAFAQQGSHGGIDAEVMCYTRYCIDLARKLKPTVWAWELVPGIFDDVKGGGRAFLMKMAEAVADEGYQTHLWLTSSALHGGFQNRKRFHFVASRVALDFEGVLGSEPEGRTGYRTLEDALDLVARADDPPNHVGGKLPGGALLDILPYCPPGGYLRELCDDIMREHYRPHGRPWNGTSRAGVTQLRGRRDRTCPVIVGGHTVIHPEKDRFLTIRENATVMGFPLDYKFSNGSKGYAEVGKGLCTHNAAFLARVVHDGLTKGIPIDTDGTDMAAEIVDWRSRAKVPSQASSPGEREAWWVARHPDLPKEWAQPRPKGKPGRRAGSPRRRQAAGPKKVLVNTFEPEGLIEALERMGFNASKMDAEQENGVVGHLEAVANADVFVIDDNNHFAMMALGVALLRGTHFVKVGIDESDQFAHSRYHLTDLKEPLQLAPFIAECAGMDAAAILAKMLEGKDAASLLAKLLAQGTS
jgi:site-specific DNA-cytosine methylase